METTTQQPFKWKWIGPIDNKRKFHSRINGLIVEVLENRGIES